MVSLHYAQHHIFPSNARRTCGWQLGRGHLSPHRERAWPIPAPLTYLCVASVRTTEESSCPSLVDTCMTYCGQLLVPAGRVLPSGAGRRSGGTPGRWLQRLVLMAPAGGSPSREQGGQVKGTSLPVCSFTTPINTKSGKKCAPTPHPNPLKPAQKAEEACDFVCHGKQPVSLQNSILGLCTAFFSTDS